MKTDLVTTAIAIVLDVAEHATKEKAVARHDICARHGWNKRRAEPVLQVLASAGILNGVRGPAGGYRIATESWTDTTLADVGRVALSVSRIEPGAEKIKDAAVSSSIGEAAEREYWSFLQRITIEAADHARIGG